MNQLTSDSWSTSIEKTIDSSSMVITGEGGCGFDNVGCVITLMSQVIESEPFALDAVAVRV